MLAVMAMYFRAAVWLDRQMKTKEYGEAGNMINRFEQALNTISDRDWSWWPLLALRPDLNQPITTAILSRLVLCFGLMSGVLMVLLLLAYQVPVTPLRVVFSLLFGSCGYLLIFGGSFVWAWNRRAARLSA